MKQIIGVLFMSISWLADAQVYSDSTLLNSKYLEDQFYIGITYNFLLNKPENISQRNLSYGLQAGIIKDIALNTTGTAALGIGVGYGVYSYYSNLQTIETPEDFQYNELMDNSAYKRSKIETHMIELPIELRWRNSTPIEYKFWRIYTGLKLGYVMGGRSKLVTNAEKISFYNKDIREFQYGLTLNFGYNTFNLHAYYALNGLFNNNAQLNGEDIIMNPLRIGLIFYIL